MLKTVVYVNPTVCVLLCFRGSVTGERKQCVECLNLTGNPRSIRGNTCDTCRRTLIAALSAIRTYYTRRSATSMDPSLTILHRIRCLPKETVSVKKRGTEVMKK